jgi:hypothetical protein
MLFFADVRIRRRGYRCALQALCRSTSARETKSSMNHITARRLKIPRLLLQRLTGACLPVCGASKPASIFACAYDGGVL